METTTTTFTRQQYLDKECTHRQYYAQFVTAGIIKSVSNRFGKNAIVKALETNEHLNNIDLARWDSLAITHESSLRGKMKQVGDRYSLAGGVCVMKEAAKQIAEA